jgi:hypothetical protein
MLRIQTLANTRRRAAVGCNVLPAISSCLYPGSKQAGGAEASGRTAGVSQINNRDSALKAQGSLLDERENGCTQDKGERRE